MHRRFYLLPWMAVAATSAWACAGNGETPDCPRMEDYYSEEQKEQLAETGKVDFRHSDEYYAWRDDSEWVGCLTPVGGSEAAEDSP